MKRKKQPSQLICGVSSGNFIIYIISLAVSIVFIGLGFIPCESFSTWATLFMSVGASGIGAVILAFFIERSNNINLQKVKRATRDAIISPMRRDLLQIICAEILIAEQETDDFKQYNQNKTLTEIIEKLENVYNEEMSKIPVDTTAYIEFNKSKDKEFALRRRTIELLGGLLNYAVDDIFSNRTYNISYNLFTDREIKDVKRVQINLFKVKNSENYAQYLFNYLEFIAWIDCYDETHSLFNDFNSIRKDGDDFFDEKGKKILLSHRSWIKTNEI